ncbi:MAG: hypothetical protein AAGA30_09900, partial [Planctomycetota bacterium]
EKRRDACLLQSAWISFQRNILHSVGQIDNFVGGWSYRNVPITFTINCFGEAYDEPKEAAWI